MPTCLLCEYQDNHTLPSQSFSARPSFSPHRLPPCASQPVPPSHPTGCPSLKTFSHSFPSRKNEIKQVHGSFSPLPPLPGLSPFSQWVRCDVPRVFHQQDPCTLCCDIYQSTCGFSNHINRYGRKQRSEIQSQNSQDTLTPPLDRAKKKKKRRQIATPNPVINEIHKISLVLGTKSWGGGDGQVR